MKVIQTPMGATELVNKRTMRSKTFSLGGTKHKLIHGLMCAHVPDDFARFDQGEAISWLDADPEIEDVGTHFRVKQAWYDLTIDKGIPGYRYVSKRGGEVRLRLQALNGTAVQLGGLTLNHQRSANTLLWPELVPGLDLILIARPAGLTLLKRLKTPAAPHDFLWSVLEAQGRYRVQRTTLAKDNENNDAARSGEVIGRNRKRLAQMQHTWSADDLSTNPGFNTRTFREQVTGKTFWRDVARKRAQLRNEIVYPVLVDADITEDIVADADDGYEVEENSYWYVNGFSNVNYMGLYSNDREHGGWRFQSIALDNAVTIDAGTNLLVNVSIVNGAGGETLTVAGDDADSPSAFGMSDRPSQMTQTTANTSAAFTSSGAKTVDVQAIIQEIVNRGGWASGQDMRLAIFSADGLAAEDDAGVYDYGHASFASDVQLEVNFTAGGGGGGATFAGYMQSRGGWW